MVTICLMWAIGAVKIAEVEGSGVDLILHTPVTMVTICLMWAIGAVKIAEVEESGVDLILLVQVFSAVAF